MTVYPAKTQISLGIRPVWSESSLSTWRKLVSLATHWVHGEDSDQTGQMPRLIWVFTGRTLILLVLSCSGSVVILLSIFRCGQSITSPIVRSTWHHRELFPSMPQLSQRRNYSCRYCTVLVHEGNTNFPACAVDRTNQLPYVQKWLLPEPIKSGINSTIYRYCSVKSCNPCLTATLNPNDNWAAAWQNHQNDLCAQQRLRSAWASTQSDQILHCLHEETLGP